MRKKCQAFAWQKGAKMNSEFTLNLNNLTEDERKEFAKLFEKVTMKEKTKNCMETKRRG